MTNEADASGVPASQGDAGTPAPVVAVDGVTMRFGGVTAVADLSLHIGEQERVAVIGPNGAGKTTLFKMIAGELTPTSGRIGLFGDDATHMPMHERARRGLARTFQVSNLFTTLSAFDNVRVAAQALRPQRWWMWPSRSADAEAQAEISDVLERVGLAKRARTVVAELSHGEQRQLEIAMALATKPRLLLLDEPAAGLATHERDLLRSLLQELPRELPWLLIEHDMSFALGLSDRVLCLHNGHQVAYGLPDEIRDDPTVQAVYLGRAAHA